MIVTMIRIHFVQTIFFLKKIMYGLPEFAVWRAERRAETDKAEAEAEARASAAASRGHVREEDENGGNDSKLALFVLLVVAAGSVKLEFE